MVRLLLAAGADPEQRTSKGRSAEDIAREEDLLGSHKDGRKIFRKTAGGCSFFFSTSGEVDIISGWWQLKYFCFSPFHLENWGR